MAPLSTTLIGTWELLSREDRDACGALQPDPALGADPLGLLIYDRSGRFAAQFMKRNRTEQALDLPVLASDNNTQAKDGYDAYFGAYVIDDKSGLVTQTLQAALAAQNVGQVVSRNMTVESDTLIISLNTANASGEAVTRTLRWRRVA
jgi:hypothetical protein